MADTVYIATGRRKESVARVRMVAGSGKITINKRDIQTYFGREVLRMVCRQPFEVTETVDQFDLFVNVDGGGSSGQAGAIKHGLARALEKYSAELRGPLKKAGFITRDSRTVERKKYGRHKARKSTQFSKR